MTYVTSYNELCYTLYLYVFIEPRKICCNIWKRQESKIENMLLKKAENRI